MNSPEDFFQFMTEEGMSEEQIQRMMNGDTKVIQEVVEAHEQANDLETTKTVSQVLRSDYVITCKCR